MTVLPIQSIDQADQPEVGKEIYQLSTLKRAGFPVPTGWAITAPATPKWSGIDQRTFEHKAQVLKKEWLQSEAPNTFSDLLTTHSKLFFRGTMFNSFELWTVLLNHWFLQLQSAIHLHNGLPKDFHLSSEMVWQLDSNGELASAVLDHHHLDVRIESSSKNKLAPKVMQQIDHLVQKADKKLFMTHSYTFWVEKDQALLIQIKPSTELILPKAEKAVVRTAEPTANVSARSVMKVILELDDQAYLTHSIDGVMLGLNDLEQLVIVSQALSDQPVFAQLDGQTNPELEGSLGLLHHKLVLEKNCRNFLVAHQKEGFNNIRLVLPVTKSAAVSAQLRRQLALSGIDRRGNLEIWQVLALPENLLQIDKYLELELDGFILDLDRLYQQLTGISDQEKAFYPTDWALLNEFINPALKKLRQVKVKIMVRGKLALFAEVLEFLVHQGVWGVIVPKIEAEGLTEHLYWTEKKIVKEREAGRIPL